MRQRVEIKKLGINGEGIGYINRKIVFVRGALPDEEVEISIAKQNRQYYEGKLLKIIRPSFCRVPSRCQSQECLGCSLLHMSYSSQLKYKKEAIKESIHKYSDIDLQQVRFQDVIASQQLEGFISSVNLPIVELKGNITFGIYQRGTKFLTKMTNCFKHHPLINQTLKELEDIFNTSHCRVYQDKYKTGLRFIKIKVIDNQVQIVVICGKDGLKDSVVKKICQLKQVVSLYMSINTTKYQEFDENGYRKLYGISRLELAHQNKYLISVKSILPVNLDMYFKRNEIIRSMLDQSQNIISLNAGLGILELELEDKEIIAIDGKKYHVEDAKLNAKHLKREHVQFICGCIEDRVIPYAKKKIYDTIIIQNERSGISQSIQETLRLAKIEHVIYVSENHSTLAKDLHDLSRYYRCMDIVGLDCQPYSSSVTTIVKLKRK